MLVINLLSNNFFHDLDEYFYMTNPMVQAINQDSDRDDTIFEESTDELEIDNTYLDFGDFEYDSDGTEEERHILVNCIDDLKNRMNL